MASQVRANAAVGLEIWAIGDAQELIVMRGQLAAAGRLQEVGDPHALAGADAGRYKQYIRVYVRNVS